MFSILRRRAMGAVSIPMMHVYHSHEYNKHHQPKGWMITPAKCMGGFGEEENSDPQKLKLKKFYVVPVVDVPAQGSQQAAANTWATENPVAAANLQAAGAAVLHAHHPAQPATEPMGGPPIQQPQAPQPPLSHPSAPAQAPMDEMAPASAPAQPGARGAFDVLNPF